MHRLVTCGGQAIEATSPDLWQGHRAITADEATVTMADTPPKKQAEYPQLTSQAPACGVPILRVIVLFALSTGLVPEMAMGRYKGRLAHEVSLFRQVDQIIEEAKTRLQIRCGVVLSRIKCR
ncbi:hypothetical protein [Rubripirellula reticaptiva]|nr:hypothetical protein [Rubripirellula reticaptiva]